MAQGLDSYRRKRRFDVTPEPPPRQAKPRRGKAPTFMVHKHDATRLHYDLRLEMDGALASWAVPKGPSFDPAIKRLAVQTEDHPLEYGGFEGRIPDGEYGGGDSLIWDRGTYDTLPPGQASQQRAKGHLHLELRGEKLQGAWHLIRTRRKSSGKEQWLLFKAKDAGARKDYDVIQERPESVASGRRITRGPETRKRLEAPHPAPLELLAAVWPPMLAKVSRLSDVSDKGLVLEVKYDGYRALAALSGGQITLQSRNGLDLSQRFPQIASALRSVIVGEAVLDGEIIAIDRKGRSHFERLGDPEAELRYAVFDLLWLDGEDVRSRPIEERRELLESLLANRKPPIVCAERLTLSTTRALDLARKKGWEGVLAKRPGSLYRAGRSADWLKLKVSAQQELAVLGYTPIRNGSPEIGALLLGVREEGTYRLAGKVGTGFDTAQRRGLWKKLEAKRIETPSFKSGRGTGLREARWVRPELVAQVAFTEWTRDGRLRHPRFLGLRLDKSAEECVRERTP